MITRVSHPATPRAGSTAAIFGVWARQEFVMLIREPVAVFFSLAFPLVIYVFLGIPYGHEEVTAGVRFIDVMFPALIMLALANLLLMGLPIYLAELRARGADRRYAILPLPGWIFAAAVLAATLLMGLLALAIITAVVGIRDGLLPTAYQSLLPLLIIASIAWLAALGFLLGALPLGSRTTQALSALVFFTMFFGSGAAVPLDGLPVVLQDIMAWNPLKQWLDVMVGVYVGIAPSDEQWLRLLLAVPLTVGAVAIGLRAWRRR